MILFWRLMLAHFVADFPLQTDAVFAAKKNTKWGVFFHGAIFGLTALLIMGPYLSIPAVWCGLFLVVLFHVAVDKAKIVLIGRRYGDHLGFFLLDQAMHIGAIALMGFLLSRLSRVALLTENSATLVPRLKLGIAYVVAIWASPVLSFYIRSALSQPGVDIVSKQSTLWRMVGYVERACLMFMVVQGGRLWILGSLIFLPRIILWTSDGDGKFSLWELIVGSAVAMAMGLWGKCL